MKSQLRITAPIMIALVAVLIYAARDAVLTPMLDSGARSQEAGVQIANDADSFGAVGFAVDDAPEAAPYAAIPLDPVEPSGANEAREGKIRKNSSLYIEMRNLGFSPVEIDGVARASRKTHNLKKVRPGQKFIAYASTSGRLDSLVFNVSRDECLTVRRAGDEFRADMSQIPFETSYHVTHGTIASSIFASLQQQGAETELASGLDEIYGWTIDFISDIRKGDSYTILYERRVYPDGETSLGNILSARVVNQGTEHHAVRYAPEGENTGYYDLEGKSLQKSLRRSPLKFTKVTSNFTGRRFHPVYKKYMPHYGVDYGAPRGTSIYATGDGVVEASEYYKGNGNYVKIRHNNSYTSYYLHMSAFAKGIRRGVHVKQGQLIGYVGSTGSATASHVCYRIKRGGAWVNPRQLNLPSKEPIPAAEMAAFKHDRDAFLASIQRTLSDGALDQTVAVDRPTRRDPDARATLF
jgi:murein DD-endopeptidase MepM/ murein hydrolase activator NlpD